MVAGKRLQQVSRNNAVSVGERAYCVLDAHAQRAVQHQQSKSPSRQQAHEKGAFQQGKVAPSTAGKPANPFLAGAAAEANARAAEASARARYAVRSVTKGISTGPMKRASTPIRNGAPSPAARASARAAALAAAAAASSGDPFLHPPTASSFRRSSSRSSSPFASTRRGAAPPPGDGDSQTGTDTDSQSMQSSSRTGTGRSREQLDAERIRWDEKYALRL